VRIRFVALCLLACACEEPAPRVASQAPAPALAPAAVVNGEEIPRRLVDEAMARRVRGRTLSDRDRDRLLRTVLRDRIEAVLVDAALRSRGIRIPSEEVTLRLARRQEELGGDEALRRFLKQTGRTLDELRGEIGREVGLARLLARRDPLRVDDAAVERVHLLEHGDVTPPLEARFSLILQRLPPDAGPVREKQTRRDLQRILKRIDGGMPFEEAAAQFSQDTSRKAGGQWEYIEIPLLEPGLRAAVESLPVGVLAGPLRTGDGWVLLRLDGRRKSMDREAEARRAAIRERLLAALREERRTKFLKRLREEATVEVAADLR